MAGGGVPSNPQVLTTRQRRVAAVNKYGRDHPESIAAARDLAALMLQERIKQVLSTAPPLTDEQRTRLAELLAPVRRGGETST